MKHASCAAGLLAALYLSSSASGAGDQTNGVILPPPPAPDPCTMETHTGSIMWGDLDIYGTGDLQIRYFVEASVMRRLSTAPADVVLIVNGNSYNYWDYAALGQHLARNGFVVLAAERTNNSSTDPQFVIDALDAGFAQLNIHPDSEVGVIGHSVGGGVVVNGVILNDTSGADYDIEALVSIAPNANDASHILGRHVTDYLLLYGSQDEDMHGTNGVPREAFAAFDRAATEGSTTCTTAPCFIFEPPMERTMIYVHGADHGGFVNKNGPATANDYLATADQFCLAKAYVNGFLRWHLKGEASYKLLLRGDWTPQSLATINSIEVDGLGNPIGTPLRRFTQFSPKQKRSIENFEDQQYAVAYQTNGVVVDLISEGQSTGAPTYVRHETTSLAVGWPATSGYKYFALWVPSNQRNASDFTDFAVRIGQLWQSPNPYTNPQNQEQQAWVGLYDGNGQFHWERLDYWGRIPRNDKRGASTAAHSGMATIAVPMSEFSSLDTSDIRAVFFAFLPNTQGTALIDNLEWFRD